VAADRRQARVIFRYVLGLIDNTPALAAMKGDETIDSVVVNSNVVIEIHTASYRAVRGYTLAAMLIDEVAFLRSEETSANPDQEIIAAVRPGLSSIPGSMLLIASSPYAKRGALYAAFRQHFGRDTSPGSPSSYATWSAERHAAAETAYRIRPASTMISPTPWPARSLWPARFGRR
jgi:hypothetical protein